MTRSKFVLVGNDMAKFTGENIKVVFYDGSEAIPLTTANIDLTADSTSESWYNGTFTNASAATYSASGTGYSTQQIRDNTEYQGKWEKYVGETRPEIFIPTARQMKLYRAFKNEQEETEMTNTHGVFKLYGLNKRTNAFMEKTIFGPLDDQEAVLSNALLTYADEIKLMLGDNTEELQFQLDGIMSYVPIKDEA